MIFIIEIRDYEAGDREVTVERIERQIRMMLDFDNSDGIVIVTQKEEEV